MNVVLFEPEIPSNTGNIARLCVATGTRLHLIRPLGFFLTDKRLRRAGLDYWEHLQLEVHDSWEDFLASRCGARLFFVETGGTRDYTQPTYEADDYFVFGSESSGLPASILEEWCEQIITVPQVRVRSLNLANTVAIVVYEAWRQLDFTEGRIN
jgi:tRNA (cytidine/uridine-2'-O-)-methyltransferase